MREPNEMQFGLLWVKSIHQYIPNVRGNVIIWKLDTKNVKFVERIFGIEEYAYYDDIPPKDIYFRGSVEYNKLHNQIQNLD